MYMAKKKIRHVHKTHASHRVMHAKPVRDSLVVVRGWMFVVAFALMLGIGAVVGTYFNTLINESTPTVAGAQIELSK
jgi:hypothetical protein